MLFSFGNHSSEIMHKAGIASSIPALCYLKGEMCEKNGLNPSEVNVYLAPFMSIAGDHAHNDLWGLEAMAEDDDVSNVEINTNEYSWRERLEKLGFKVDRTFESHPTDQAGADHGIKDGCNMKALGSYPEIRQIWVNHLYENWNDDSAWENGEDYQPEA